MNKRTFALLVLLVVASIALPVGDSMVHGQRGDMIGTLIIETVDEAGAPVLGACVTAGFVGQPSPPTSCDVDPRDGAIEITWQPTEVVVREAAPPTGYVLRDPQPEYVVTVPYHDVVSLTLVYLKTDEQGESPAGESNAVTDDLRAEVLRLKDQVEQLEDRVWNLQQRALPPANPNAQVGPGYVVLRNDPTTFRIACTIYPHNLGAQLLECARLP